MGSFLKKYQKLVLITVSLLLVSYISIVKYEVDMPDNDSEQHDLFGYASSTIKSYFIAKADKDSYFKSDQKQPMDAESIRIILGSENSKYSKDRKLEMEAEEVSKQEKIFEPIDKNGDYTKSHDSDTPVSEGNQHFQSLFAKFADVLLDNRLIFPHPERITTNKGKPVIWETKFVELPYDMLSESDLSQYMDFDDDFVADLKKKHRNIVNSLPTKQVDFYSGDGYVMVGGGWYTWYAFLSIQALRKTGSTLPIELIFPSDDEYEEQLCNDILPNQYNTKCVKLSTVFGSELLARMGELKGYQFKSFALLGSSFENILYLDSDNFALENPDHLLQSELFKKYNFITWPDFWRRTSSPYLYQILGIKVGNKPIRQINDFYTPPEKYTKPSALIEVENTINLHDRKGTLSDWTTESGQFLINKKIHFTSLLLALYYNFDGPAGYHPLLSQGGAGEGDKETLVLASHYLKLPHYQLYKKPDKLYGTFLKEVNYFIDSTIVQYDPIQDYESLKLNIVRNQRDLDTLGKDYIYSYMYTYGTMPSDNMFPEKVMFYHIHSPKMNPWEYLTRELFTDPRGKTIRNFGDDYPKTGKDVEYIVWKLMVDDICGDEKFVNFKCFQDQDLDFICNNSAVDKRLAWLKETGEGAIASYRAPNYDKKLNAEISMEKSKELDDFIYDSIMSSLNFEYIQ